MVTDRSFQDYVGPIQQEVVKKTGERVHVPDVVFAFDEMIKQLEEIH